MTALFKHILKSTILISIVTSTLQGQMTTDPGACLEPITPFRCHFDNISSTSFFPVQVLKMEVTSQGTFSTCFRATCSINCQCNLSEPSLAGGTGTCPAGTAPRSNPLYTCQNYASNSNSTWGHVVMGTIEECYGSQRNVEADLLARCQSSFTSSISGVCTAACNRWFGNSNRVVNTQCCPTSTVESDQ